MKKYFTFMHTYNPYKVYWIFSLILAWGMLFCVSAQTENNGTSRSVQEEQVIAEDTTPVQVRMPEQASLDAFRNNSDFRYDRDIKQGTTFRELIRYYLRKFLAELFGTDVSFKWVRVALIVLLVGFTVFILLKMFGINATGIFFNKPSSAVNLSESVLEENTEKGKLKEMLEQAVSEGRYRLAVRLTYLLMLRQLSDSGKIHWQPDKTNRSYSYEINESVIREPFLRIAGLYEYVWYGDFDITAEHYRNMETDFNELNRYLR